MAKTRKVVFIYALLIEDPEAYEGKTNTDIEKEILADVGPIPYVAYVEKVTVLDFLTKSMTKLSSKSTRVAKKLKKEMKIEG